MHAQLVIFVSTLFAQTPPEEIRIGSLGSRGVTFTEERPGTFDEAVSGAGDVNGDGRADFLLLHHDMDADYEPTVFLVYGRPDLPRSIAVSGLAAFATAFRRSVPRSGLGDIVRGMAEAGDLDRDGFDDFFIFRWSGAPPEWTGATSPGVVHLVHGAASLPREVGLDSPPPGVRITLFTSTKTTLTNLCLSASLGDLNGDGSVDIAFGAGFSAREAGDTRYGPGRVYVLFGGAAWTGTIDVEEAGRERPGFILEGDEEFAGMGKAVAFTGDANGDGLGDLLVGDGSASGARPSRAYLVFGAQSFPDRLTPDDILAGSGVRFLSTEAASGIGEALTAPGDWNGDGLADFVIGALGTAGGAGAAYLVHGRTDFESDISLHSIAGSGLGVAFRGEAGDALGGDLAGRAVAALDFQGDGTRDLVVGAYGAADRGIRRIGRAYVVEGGVMAPGERSLGEVRAGTLAGALITAEVSLESESLYTPRLGSTLAAAGDVNGDGLEDLLISAPSNPASFNDDRSGVVHLVYGRGGDRDPLRLDRVEPSVAGIAGGIELTILGAGLDATVGVRIGGALAPVKRVVSSARLVVEAPPLEKTGPADVLAARGAETAALPGGVRYVPRVHPGVDVRELGRTGQGAVVRGRSRFFGGSLAFLDLDDDGFADMVAATGTGSFIVLYGSGSLPGELALPDLEGGETLEGASLIRAPMGSRCERVGDVNGDGLRDLAVLQPLGMTLLFGGERLAAKTDLESLVIVGRGAEVLNFGPPITSVAGGGDIDADGLGDLLVGAGGEGSRTVYLVPGRRDWPGEIFLQDSPSLSSTGAGDRLGAAVAMPGDVDGDGRDDVLIGAPGISYGDDGNAYLVFGGAGLWSGGETVQDLVARGEARRLDSFKPKDGLGHDVSSVGDFSGDGIADLALSAGDGGVSFQGESYLVFGGPHLRQEAAGAGLSMASLGRRGVRILGEETYDHATRLAPAGDFNGDGLADLLIGAESTYELSGKSYVVFGGASADVLLYELGGDGIRMFGGVKLGSAVAGGGDLNGDGTDDVLIADGTRIGPTASVFIVFGDPDPGIFLRGDSNGDRQVQISDVVHLLGYLYLGSRPPDCLDAGDGNDDGILDLTDAVYVLSHLFLGGPAPPAPFPGVGADPTLDSLACGG